jgi:hypothetical protein
MRTPRIVQLAALVCCAALVYAAATRMPAINDGRKLLNIMGSDSPLENTPPEYVFYIQAFGAFRGLIADIAFIRAEQLKEQGRFYDAMQLHKWICALQPHFPSVWEYAAWNMAWNISVTTFTPQERWNWVYNGVKLLRDQGIPLNPRAVNLYKQLAWTFNNKMSEPTDTQHYAYKCNWAWRMHLLLGPPPDPLAGQEAAELADQVTSTQELDLLEQAGRQTFAQSEEQRRKSAELRGQEFTPRELPQPGAEQSSGELSEYQIAQRAAADRIRRIQEAPASLAELFQRYPQTRHMVAELQALGIDISDDPLTEDSYWREEGLAFAFFKPYRELMTPGSALARVAREQTDSHQAQARKENLARILGLSQRDPAGEALVRFLQRKVLSEVYKLDPNLMLELVETFGPMDWRCVDSQSLYWVARGLIAGGETINQFGNDKTNTARIIFFSLRNLFLRNHLVFEPNPEKIHLSYLSLSQDLNFIEPMHQAYVKFGPLFDPDTGGVPGAGDTFRTGHINFLGEAVRLLYLAGREAEAAHYYRYLRETYATTPTGEPNPAFAKTLHDFVMDNFRESIVTAGTREIGIIIGGWLYNAYSVLAEGDVTTYVRLVRTARDYHESYMRDKRADVGYGHVLLKDFLDLQVDAFGAWLARPPISPASTLHKARLWRQAPLYLRQSVYDDLFPQLKSECDYWDFDVAKAFPEPTGMAEYRLQHPERFRTEPESQAP